MSGRWYLRQLRVLVDPAGPVTGKVMFERGADQRLRRLRKPTADAASQRTRPSRARMRALVLLPGGRLEWRGVPAPPPPGPLGAVVRPSAVATCDLDRPTGLGATPFLTPLQFGHECVAKVLTVGAEVSSLRPGTASSSRSRSRAEIAGPAGRGAPATAPRSLRSRCVARSHARALIPGVLQLMSDGSFAPERVTAVATPLDDVPAAPSEHLRGGSTNTIVAAPPTVRGA